MGGMSNRKKSFQGVRRDPGSATWFTLHGLRGRKQGYLRGREVFWNIKSRSLISVPKLTYASMGSQVCMMGDASATSLPVSEFQAATSGLRKCVRPLAASTGRCDNP